MDSSAAKKKTDQPYADALSDYVIQHILHPAMFRADVDINETFKKIDELVDNYSDGPDPRDIRKNIQAVMKHTVLVSRFPQDYKQQVTHFNLEAHTYPAMTIVELIAFVKTHARESNNGLSFMGSKLFCNSTIMGCIGLGLIAVCGIAYIAYKKYYAKDEENEEEGAHDDHEKI